MSLFQYRKILPSLFLLGGLSSVQADWLEDTGMNELQEYLRVTSVSSTTNGIPVSITEANSFNDGDPDNVIELRYLPTTFPTSETVSHTPTTGSYSGVTFTNESIDIVYDDLNNYNGIIINIGSGHASTVASQYFAPSTYASGVTNVYCHEAGNFINTILNGQLSILDGRIMSHAWVGRTVPTSTNDINAYTALINRFDYLASTGNTLMVVGVDNGASQPVPTLWGLAYNALQVGVTDGDHSNGDTSSALVSQGITAGRTRPDIVSNNGFTSFATGQVASGATYIHGLAKSLSYNTIVSNTDLQRAIILAGATKDEFPSWENMSTNPSSSYPLDPNFGAGEMNIFNSHRIVEGGTPTSSAIGYHGWDRASVGGNTETYTFTIPPEVASADISLAVCWDREITENTSGFGPFASYSYDPETLANLRVELSGGSLSSTVFSDSTLDNVEHIYTKDLTAGTYQVRVSNNSGSFNPSEYGLAWCINLKAENMPCYSQTATGLAISDLISGVTYDVEESTDLSNWDYVNSFTATSNAHTWTDPSPSSGVRHFYRLKYWE